jgi:glycosyltransferase involved in cell wall biosynthesis
MKNLKINIIFDFKEEVAGGGYQFLKALKGAIIEKGFYENNPLKANCFLFNSHHNIARVLSIKSKKQDNIFIHRIDGPTYLTKRKQPKLDFKIYELNRYLADGTIFQSNWSERENYVYGLEKTSFTKVINNAPNSKIFFPIKNKKIKDGKNGKCRLVATSWSTNMNKGFKLYKFLDNNLNFKEFSMIFIGRSPISFKNIKYIRPVDSEKLADYLRNGDIYISGAINEACSNSLLEALHCGLPCVVINNASNPELVKNGGELFNNFSECIEKIELIRDNYENYRNKKSIRDLEKITKSYIDFIKSIHNLKISKKYKPKKLRNFEYYKILFKNNLFQISKLKIIIYEFFRIISTIMRKY